MSFGLLKYGERCDRHAGPRPRGMDARTVVYTDISGRQPIAPATGTKPVGPPTPLPAAAAAAQQPGAGTTAVLAGKPATPRAPTTNTGNLVAKESRRTPASAPPPLPLGSTDPNKAIPPPAPQQPAGPTAALTKPATPRSSRPTPAATPSPLILSSAVPPPVPSLPVSAGPSTRTPTPRGTPQLSARDLVEKPKPQRKVIPKPKLQLSLKRPTAAELDKLFLRVDFNGNGMLSLAELDKAVIELWPHYDHKPAIMRAYKACDVDNSGFVNKREFRLFFLYLQIFDLAWNVFEQIDINGDRRLTIEELVAGAEALRATGVSPAASELRQLFGQLDTNHGGFVLFDEFCRWFADEAVRAERRNFKNLVKVKKVQSGTERTFLEVPTAGVSSQLFNRLDFNGNGMLSLAELDKAIVELWPQFDNKPAIMRAYKACDANGTGFISRKEFRNFLTYLVVYQNLWNRFQLIDTSGDRRLTIDEFIRGKKHLGSVAGRSDDECSQIFHRIDRNGGGFVLFDEFCAFFAQEATETYRSRVRPDDPREVTCVGLPRFCHLCGHIVSFEHWDTHSDKCQQTFHRLIQELPSILRFEMPPPPDVELNDPEALQEYNEVAKQIFHTESTRSCPECKLSFTVASLKVHWRKHKLTLERERELRRSRTKSPKRVASVSRRPPGESEPQRLGRAIVECCKKSIPDLKVLRRNLDCERSSKPGIGRRDFELVLVRSGLAALIERLDLGQTFDAKENRREVKIVDILEVFPSDSLTSPKKKYHDPQKLTPAPNAVVPKQQQGGVAVNLVAKFTGGDVEQIRLENSTGTMKVDKHSLLRRLRMMGYRDIQSIELLE